MKIRNGFVSNSSSASFIIIGRQISFSEIQPGDLVYAVGKELMDGMDVFEVTPEIYEWLKARNRSTVNSSFIFYCARAKGVGFDWVEGSELPNVVIQPGDAIHDLDKDYHSCNSLSDVETYYNEMLADDEQEELEEESSKLPVHRVTYIGRTFKEGEDIKSISGIWAFVKNGGIRYLVHLFTPEDLEFFKQMEGVTFVRVKKFVRFGEDFENPLHLDGDRLFDEEVNFVCTSIHVYKNKLKDKK